MRSNRKRYIKESKTNSIYDMIAAIEDRIDELEDMDFYGEDYFESYKPVRESSKKKLTTVVSRAEWEKLRVFLKKNKIEYNPSEYGKDVHVQVWVDNDERKAVDNFIDTLDESYWRTRLQKRNNKMTEGKKMPYVLWVLDGDDKQWKMYKGVNDAAQFVRENDWEEFLDALNIQVYPNGTYYNNYIDWVVIPEGEHPKTFDVHKFYNNIKYGL